MNDNLNTDNLVSENKDNFVSFSQMNLASELLEAIKELGYTQATEVQIKTIPLAMQNNNGEFTDLMVSSQTGSGKTAAFLLPLLNFLITEQKQKYKESRDNKDFEKRKFRSKFQPAIPTALVVCPTRELAQQVMQDAINLLKKTRGVRVASVVGGMPYRQQILRLQNSNLVIATPGRLLDLHKSMQIKLDKVKFLVVDEADRMLDLGFSEELTEISQLTEQRQQTMMFSATFAPRIQKLALNVMRNKGGNVEKITVSTPQEKHASIKQVLYWADNLSHKRKLLDHCLRDTEIEQAIIFVSTQMECDALASDLQDSSFSALSLHGALNQNLRNRRLSALRNRKIQFLVATDVAARGIDVPTISHVFNFSLPMKSEDYTHRIGRTGRAGREGLAITFAEFRDRRKIFDIEDFTKQIIDAQTIEGLEPTQKISNFRPQKNHQSRHNPRGRSGHNFNSRGGFGSDRRNSYTRSSKPSFSHDRTSTDYFSERTNSNYSKPSRQRSSNSEDLSFGNFRSNKKRDSRSFLRDY